jgi:hypothetical protein
VQQAQAKGYQYVTDAAGLRGVNDDKPVLGLFNSGNMSLEWSGPAAALGKGNTPAACAENQRPANEPSLAEMTVSAIKPLENRKGFFLQVEGASIDKQDHATNACGQLGETVAFDKAIGVALDYQRSHPDTLVVVTADHSHTSQIVSEDASGSGLPTGYSTNLLTRTARRSASPTAPPASAARASPPSLRRRASSTLAPWSRSGARVRVGPRYSARTTTPTSSGSLAAEQANLPSYLNRPGSPLSGLPGHTLRGWPSGPADAFVDHHHAADIGPLCGRSQSDAWLGCPRTTPA